MPNISQPLVSEKYMPEATKMVFFSISFGKQDVRLQRFLVSDFTRILYKWSNTIFRKKKKLQKLGVTENLILYFGYLEVETYWPDSYGTTCLNNYSVNKQKASVFRHTLDFQADL